MKILGLMMIRNGEKTLSATLDQMSEYCDSIFVLDDRSTDSTRTIAAAHPAVGNIFTARPALSDRDWFFSEGENLNLLYRMADFYRPDWILRLDCDEYLKPASEVRKVLSDSDDSVAGLSFPKESVWDDPEYPQLVPLLGRATSMQGAIWRYYPDLQAHKPMHNARMPDQISKAGSILESHRLTFYHTGWRTLQQRVDRVDRYMSLDPKGEWNSGVPYDRGLLFGFARSEIAELKAKYRARMLEVADLGTE
jgi:glycosyltransferase involved in cell wall biosynthesis